MNLTETLAGLYAEKEKLELAIAACVDLFNFRGESITGVIKEPSRRGRKSMGSKERGEVSLRMKRYWASRRKNPDDPE